MIPYIIYNGIASIDLDLIVEQLPDENRPKRNVEEIQIEGRDGRATVDLGSYDMYQTKMKINCNGRAPTEIYAWLKGEGWLTTSDDPEYMRWVGFHDQISDDRFRADACYDTLTIPIRVQPYKYQAIETPLEIKEAAIIDGQGNENAKPILEIIGSGSANLMINNATVLIDNLNGTLYLDCDAKYAYTEIDGEKVSAGKKVTVVDEWPYLTPDKNLISWSGGITSVIIHPWWRWI